jgi:hypothetical protein
MGILLAQYAPGGYRKTTDEEGWPVLRDSRWLVGLRVPQDWLRREALKQEELQAQKLLELLEA